MRLTPALPVLAALSLSACIKVNVPEDAFFYPNTRLEAENIVLPVGKAMPDGSQALTIAYEGGHVAATHVPGADAGPVILFCGGNMFRRATVGGARAEVLDDFGDAVLFDYPGYGETPGEADLATFRLAGNAVADRAKSIADAEGRLLVAWGHSLGGPVCTEAAVRMGADALVLEATTPTARAAVDSSIGWWLKPFLRVQLDPQLASFDIVQSLAGYPGKVIVLEAGRDETLPARLSRQIEDGLKAEGVNVTRLVFRDSTHNAISAQPDFKELIAAALAGVGR